MRDTTVLKFSEESFPKLLQVSWSFYNEFHVLKALHWNAPEGTGSEYEDFYGAFKKLVRYSEYSNSDNFKELSGLVQILGFL